MVGNIQKKIQEKKRALNSLSIDDRGTRGVEINQLRRELMISYIVRRPFGDSAARFIGIGKGIETQSFSMPVLLREGKRIPFWGYGTMMVNSLENIINCLLNKNATIGSSSLSCQISLMSLSHKSPQSQTSLMEKWCKACGTR